MEILLKKNLQIQSLITCQRNSIRQERMVKSQAINYQLIQECSIPQKESCFAVAINKDCSTQLVKFESQIKVFEFKQGVMQLIQCLSEHQKWVVTSNFRKKLNQFIFESYDN
ncbi:unnamed protein product [Paramecium octaurelia]|uniref:Uncharacterized protein n=1 Tax=Paramecium octaurelia TaxID=43137 RepID=A0A8S1YKV5_PAROT|nr:unnamed protein product [Paramecium octaurelia]